MLDLLLYEAFPLLAGIGIWAMLLLIVAVFDRSRI